MNVQHISRSERAVHIAGAARRLGGGERAGKPAHVGGVAYRTTQCRRRESLRRVLSFSYLEVPVLD